MKRNDEIQVCGNCVFWRFNRITHNLGDCRKNAPTGQKESIWPHTNIWEWCGAWEYGNEENTNTFLAWFEDRKIKGNYFAPEFSLFTDLMERRK